MNDGVEIFQRRAMIREEASMCDLLGVKTRFGNGRSHLEEEEGLCRGDKSGANVGQIHLQF